MIHNSKKLWAMKFIVYSIWFLTWHRTCVSIWAALSHGWHARVKSEKNYPLKRCGEHKVLGNMRNCVIWLMESSASAPLYCKYVTKIFLREFPCHHTSQHRMFAQNSEEVSSSRRYFMHLKEMLKLFHLLEIKMSKRFHDWPKAGWSLNKRQLPANIYFLII